MNFGPLRPGQIFSTRYRIERLLAKGGFGAVYVAERIETELRVALKVLASHWLHSDRAVEKFKLEARVANRIGSEHIVKVFDAGFDEETQMPFLAMELLQGENLEELVERTGPLPFDKVVTYLGQIASALDKAHGYIDRDGSLRPIVHRDLKPENLFLTHRETGEPLIKILDFGIAKVLSEQTHVSRELKGTPLYMAREQAVGERITPQTDIWPLGLIAFFLLTGRCYWKCADSYDPSLSQLLGEIVVLPLDAPSKRAIHVGAQIIPPPKFDSWFVRCVNRDVSLRFASAGECARALAELFEMRSSHAALDVTELRVRPFANLSSSNPSQAADGRATSSQSEPPRSRGSLSNTLFAAGGTKPPPSVQALPGRLTTALASLVLIGVGAAVGAVLGKQASQSAAAPPPALSRLPLPHAHVTHALSSFRHGASAPKSLTPESSIERRVNSPAASAD